jgi:putative transcriptional regulator
MQLESNLSTLMGRYRYTIQDVHEKTGLSRNTISSLYNNKATRIDYKTIEKLCQLFKCGVGQLFIFSSVDAHESITIEVAAQ